MSALTLSHGRRAQKTFAIAMTILGVVAAAQILGALYLYTRRPHEEHRTPNAVEARLFRQKPAPDSATTAVQVPAVAGVPSARIERIETPPRTVPETLLRVAKGFRERGDTTNAIAKLQQAIALDPGNPEILAELALTYESMQLFDRSNEAWRRLQSLGPTAGPLYELADVKLRVGVPARSSATAEPAPAQGDTAGVPDGSTFGISEVTLKREQDPEAQTKLSLRVGVKVRPDVPIDHTKVKIQVFFYDMVNNDQVVLTDADVSFEWITPGHDWVATGTEVLDVTYLRPQRNDPAPGSTLGSLPVEVPDSVEKARRAERKPSAASDMLPTSENGPREYLGYIVRVYYKDQLQAVRAEPTRLLNLFPPPFTAPPQ
ncbi:MAG: tetratricopeptide repeat protein [Chthoniobacterales bacterium]|nr:tetratricopeptide repeat protein [Chthoniobacterales bacterium]